MIHLLDQRARYLHFKALSENLPVMQFQAGRAPVPVY